MNKSRKRFMKRYIFLLSAAILTIFAQCDTLKSLPTNTSGGLFSLNGSWQLSSTSDNRALEGTTITIVPGVAEATVRTLANNTYCLRERDVIWQSIKSFEGGTFTADLLVNACSGSTVYRPATLTVVTNDEIRIKGSTASSAELLQTWKRVSL
jgi:hypothetical protein